MGQKVQDIRQEQYLTRYGGPLLTLLNAADTLDVVVNADRQVWVNRLGRGFEHTGSFAASDAELLLQGIATVQQRRLDYAHPILETIFPLTGDRIEGIIPPVVRSAILAIRTRQKQRYELEDWDRSGVLTNASDPVNTLRQRDDFLDRVRGLRHLDILRLAIQYRRNILLVGPTGSGKTTFANSLLSECNRLTPGDRIVFIEDTPELQCMAPNHVALLETAQASMSDLLAASMRLIPRRLVVGEVRLPRPARILLTAWNSGHSGGLCTIHADDTMGGLRKLENLLGGHRLTVRERIAAAIHVAVFIDGDETIPAGRKVREVAVMRSFDRTTQDYVIEYV